MSQFEDQCVSVYENLSKVSSLEEVIVSKSDEAAEPLHWEASWSHRDISRNCPIKYRTNGIINYSGGKFENMKSFSATELNAEKMICISPSGKLKAVMRECNVKDEKHNFLEVWKGSRKISSIDLIDQKKHGLVHTNATFCSLEWSRDDKQIAYIAEKKAPKSKSFFSKSPEDTDSDKLTPRGEQFVYKEDWGEQLVGSYHPSVFVYDISTGDITDLSSRFPEDASIAKVLWSANGKSIFALAWHGSPWKLGLIYCKNRPSCLYRLNLESQKPVDLTGGKTCVYSPTLSPDGTKLIYLETVPFAAHGQCSKLMCIDLTDHENVAPKVVVARVEMPQDFTCFQGLFVDAIPRNTWLSNGHQIILHSIHRSNIALLSVDISSGEVAVIEKEGSWKIHYVSDDILFVSHSTPNMPDSLKAGRFHETNIEWTTLDSPFSQIDGISWSIQKHEPKLQNKVYPRLDYESVLIKPSGNAPLLGLIVNPHGGPHSCFTAGFDLFSACFCKLGFAVLRINYRGSLGFGHNCVLSLSGNIGSQDVCDVQQAAESTVADLEIPPGKIFVQGGSHGGFLTLHLVGQHPQFYAAGATRNPVADVSSMRSTSDIMDWCYYEIGHEFDHGLVPSSAILEKLLKVSPIIHVNQVKAPLLFMIGWKDLRVPSQQSLEYVHALQALGKKVRVLKYENSNHPIADVDAEANCFVNMAKWFYSDYTEEVSLLP